MTEIVAMADEAVDKEADKEIDARSTNADTAKWTIIPPKQADRENCTEHDTINGDTNTSRYNERICYHCCLTEHFKANSIHFNHAWDPRNKVNEGTASTSHATAGDRDLIWLAEDATALTAASTQAGWVIDSRASHHMCIDLTWFESTNILGQPIVTDLGEYNKVTVIFHGLVNVPQ